MLVSKKLSHKSAFTLLEMTFVIFIIGLISQTLLTSIQIYQKFDQALRDDQSLTWQHFLIVLEREIQLYPSCQAQEDYIQITNPSRKETYQIILNNHKVYKTPGYQPFLFEVKSWWLNDLGDVIELQVVFQNDQSYQGWIHK